MQRVISIRTEWAGLDDLQPKWTVDLSCFKALLDDHNIHEDSVKTC